VGHPALDLSGKTAVVIGGTSGIGLALARLPYPLEYRYS
jgi:short-subunit dehydrogenase involved in D-alanine esterification of teichoic acids